MENLIQPHHPNWTNEYERLSSFLKMELKDFLFEIFHVGSTSIPNLYAKPILDIDITIQDLSLLSPIASKLEQLGYLNKGNQGIENRFAFRQKFAQVPITNDKKMWQEHHLYVCLQDSLAFRNHIIVKQSLLSDEKLVSEYSNLKKKLIAEKGMTREIYNKRKTDFIIKILENNGLSPSEIQEIIRTNK